MSDYYNPRRTRNLYKKDSPFRLSRSKIDLFIECPRCFYLDRKLGIGRPPGFPFALNSAVDALLKKEFDFHRANATPHPLMDTYKVDAVPFKHEKMNIWRDSLRGGVEAFDKLTNLTITGGVDDIWVNKDGELIVVDYKATAKMGEVNIDAEWQGGYKRQVEIYQWLLRQNGFNVSDTAYFVYANGKLDKEAFDSKIEFNVKLISYKGNDNWISDILLSIKKCLDSDKIPEADKDCDYCLYRHEAKKEED
jgi:hypothetical protein